MKSASTTNDLIDPAGHRLYLIAGERVNFLAAARASRDTHTLLRGPALHRLPHLCGADPRRVDLDKLVLVFTLEKRRSGVFRKVPVPAAIDTLNRVFGLREARQWPADPLLWAWNWTTAWRDVKDVMRVAGIQRPQATPKGLRHGYGGAAVGAAVPLNMLAKWMGYAAIYANALGEEQRSVAERMWR